MSSKNAPKLPRTPMYVSTVLLIAGFALTIAGLFVDISIMFAFAGLAVVIIGAIVKGKYYCCPHCGAFGAVRKANINFTPFNCPRCRKKVDFEPKGSR